MKAELVPDNGDPAIPILRDVTVVGRHADCDVVIDHVSLSKRHCVIVKTDGLLVIRDLATTNGTKVKGQRVRWAALLPEDRLSLGGYKVRVYLGSDEMPSPSEKRNRAKASLASPVEVDVPAPVTGLGEIARSSATGHGVKDEVFPGANGRESAADQAESRLVGDGFEIIDDDDDEIIDLS